MYKASAICSFLLVFTIYDINENPRFEGVFYLGGPVSEDDPMKVYWLTSKNFVIVVLPSSDSWFPVFIVLS